MTGPMGNDNQGRPKHSLRRRPRRRGAEVLELAFALPLLLLCLFGICEFGRLVMVQQVLTNAVREGARAVVVRGGTDQECLDAIDRYLTAAKIATYTAPTITPSGETAASGTAITVQVDVPLNSAAWFPPTYVTNKTLVGRVIMIKE